MNATQEVTATEAASPYIGMWTKRRQCVVVLREQAHLPHVFYTFWDGGGYCGGWFAVLPGQTTESAALAHPRSGYERFRCSAPEFLSSEYPS